MAKILLGWELGTGIGYARRLQSIAGRLAAHGHEPVLALREPAAAESCPYPVLRAPQIVGRLTPGTARFVPAGFADLMACNGFGAEDHLGGILAEWSALIGSVQPHLVIAEYAPALVLAAWRRLPTLLIGTPYLAPPAEGERFPERRGAKPYADQGDLLAVARAAQSGRGAALPDRITQPFAEAARIVYSLPELDPWSDRRRERLYGLWEPLPPAEKPANRHIFAYLSPRAPGFAAAMAGLTGAGIAAEAFIPDLPPEHRNRLAAAGITLHDSPPPIGPAIGRASLVFHHGGIDTAQVALALGRPQLVMPRYLDQRLTGEAIHALGTGRLLPPRSSAEEVAAGLRALADDVGIAQKAELRSVLIRRRGLGAALPAAAETALRLIG